MTSSSTPQPPGLDGASVRPVSPVLIRGLILVSLLGCAALAWTLTTDRREAAARDEQLAAKALELTLQIQLEEQWIRDAIRDQRAIVGMTAEEVILAKGRPQRVKSGPSLAAAYRKEGGVEHWLYDATGPLSGVLFGVNGRVVYADDVAGKPRFGNAVRQR